MNFVKSFFKKSANFLKFYLFIRCKGKLKIRYTKGVCLGFGHYQSFGRCFYIKTAFCCKVLRNENPNIYAERKRRNESEKSIENLSEKEIINTSVCDSYFIKVFEVCGMKIPVADDRLAEAISELSLLDKKIILLSYFAGKTDKTIASMLKLNSYTIFRHRTSSLNKLKTKLTKGD